MTAKQIIRNSARWKTQYRTAGDCDNAILNVTDFDDWWESWVLYENTLRAQDIMAEATK